MDKAHFKIFKLHNVLDKDAIFVVLPQFSFKSVNMWLKCRHPPFSEGGRTIIVKVEVPDCQEIFSWIQHIYWEFTTKCKQLVTLKKRKVELDFAKKKKHLKESAQSEKFLCRWNQSELIQEWEERSLEKINVS